MRVCGLRRILIANCSILVTNSSIPASGTFTRSTLAIPNAHSFYAVVHQRTDGCPSFYAPPLVWGPWGLNTEAPGESASVPSLFMCTFNAGSGCQGSALTLTADVSSTNVTIGPMPGIHQPYLDSAIHSVVHVSYTGVRPALPVPVFGYYVAVVEASESAPPTTLLPRNNGTLAQRLALPQVNSTSLWVFAGLSPSMPLDLSSLLPGES